MDSTVFFSRIRSKAIAITLLLASFAPSSANAAAADEESQCIGWGLSALIARGDGTATGPRARTYSPEDAAVITSGMRELGRDLTPLQEAKLIEAHHVGDGEPGADGTPARVGNYTFKQLAKKTRLLKAAGFNQSERGRLVRLGVAGAGGTAAAAAVQQGILRKHKAYKDPEFAASHEVAIKEIAKKYGVNDLTGRSYFQLIDKVYSSIKESSGLSDLKKANKMAKMGEELAPHIKKLSKKDRRTASFYLAKAVMALESYKSADFVEVPASSFTIQPENLINTIHFQDYKDWVIGFVDNVAPYKDAPEGGLLTQKAMRDLEVHNYWPIYLHVHDMNHAHYAFSHPRALAAFFASARSKNHLRYVMMSAMYEGVDTVQFSAETQIAKYMKLEKKFDLEQALIYLGGATHEELINVATESGTLSYFKNMAEGQEGYVPERTQNYGPQGISGKGLDVEVDMMVNTFESLRNQPGMGKYFHYKRNRENKPWSGDEIHKSGEQSKPASELYLPPGGVDSLPDTGI